MISDLLSELPSELIGDDAADQVGPASDRGLRDDLDRFAWVLGSKRRRDGRHQRR